jgi:hypothetical protein
VAAQDFGGDKYLVADAFDCLAYRILSAVHFCCINEESA